MSVHPTMPELERFVKREISDESRREAIARHLQSCEFCNELALNLTSCIGVEDKVSPEIDQTTIERICERSYQEVFRGVQVELRPLEFGVRIEPRLLAADGVARQSKGIEVLATLYSDSPEVVLRVMRDTVKRQEYIQLVSDDPDFPNNVLIATSNPEKRFVLDSNGRAELRFRDWEGLISASWHVQMPELSWELEPFQYDADTVESQSPLVIDNQRGDVIELVYQKLAIGTKLIVQVRSLDGNEDFGSAYVVVSSESSANEGRVEPKNSAEFTVTSQSQLSIRLYK